MALYKKSVQIEVEVNLDDLSIDDLKQEVIRRGFIVVDEEDYQAMGEKIATEQREADCHDIPSLLADTHYPDWLVDLVREWQPCPWALTPQELVRA